MRGSVAIGSLVVQDIVAGALSSRSEAASDMHGWTIHSSYSVTSCLSSGSSDSSRLSLEKMGLDQVTGAECFQLEPYQAALDAATARQGFRQHIGSLQPLMRLITGFRLLVNQCSPQRLCMASLNFSQAGNLLEEMGVSPSDSSSFPVLIYCC